MRTILTILGSLAWCAAAAGQTAASSAADQEAIEKASVAWMAAFNQRDMAAFASVMDDGYISTADDGTISTKERILKFVGSREPEYIQRKDRHGAQVRLDGDVAIVSYGLTRIHGWGSTTVQYLVQRTEVFRKKKGRWLMIASHESNFPHNYFQALETDPKLLADYVGTYDWPRHREYERDHITLEDGRLMSEWRGDKKENLRMAKDTFFNRDDTGWQVFIRDEGGRVTGYTYYYPDGQPVPVKRID